MHRTNSTVFFNGAIQLSQDKVTRTSHSRQGLPIGDGRGVLGGITVLFPLRPQWGNPTREGLYRSPYIVKIALLFLVLTKR
jgi:hypothetical protein